MSESRAPQQAPSLLEQISTQWPAVSDPLLFTMRYAPAVHSYLNALVKNPHDAEDVAQKFLLRTLQQPYTADQVHKGRFRDYLKAALRFTAITHFRQTKAQSATLDLEAMPAPSTEASADQAWLDQWKNCLLQRAWESIEQLERAAPDGLAYTVLQLATEHPTENSASLALRASTKVGRPIKPDAFRKQLSRARAHFARNLIAIVQQTLVGSSPDDVHEELASLGLLVYVRDYLPDADDGSA
jgi:hypothetical protein